MAGQRDSFEFLKKRNDADALRRISGGNSTAFEQSQTAKLEQENRRVLTYLISLVGPVDGNKFALDELVRLVQENVDLPDKTNSRIKAKIEACLTGKYSSTQNRVRKYDLTCLIELNLEEDPETSSG